MQPNIVLVQVIASIFAIFALTRAYLRFKEKKLSSFAFIFWMFVWIAGMVFIFIPDLATGFAKLIGIGRGVDAILYASIIVLFYMIFRLYIKIEDTERLITQVARKIALLEPSAKSSKNR